MKTLDDEALVAEYRSTGNSKFVNELFERYQGRVSVWCYRMSGRNRELAADLSQEVFVKVFRHLDSFRGGSKFGTWVFSIARNHCFNAIRSQASKPVEAGGEALEPLAADDQPDAYAQLEKKDAEQLMRELIQRSLDETERQVMVLHYVEELPINTITSLLNLTNASGAKAHIVSGRRKLKSALERWQERGKLAG